MGLLRFAIKSSIAGGVVYYTIQEGLWGTADESAKLYNKLYNNVSPLVQKNVPVEVMSEIKHIPNPGDFKVCVAAHWNKYVRISMQFIADLPTHISNGVDRIQKEIEKSNLSATETVKPIEAKKTN